MKAAKDVSGEFAAAVLARIDERSFSNLSSVLA
jgi:hypothetical protein